MFKLIILIVNFIKNVNLNHKIFHPLEKKNNFNIIFQKFKYLKYLFRFLKFIALIRLIME
jgi:hypothetical protein